MTPSGSSSRSVTFEAAEYHADGSFAAAHYRYDGSPEDGWLVQRNGARHLELGPGYRLLRTLGCGVCSTDLDRHFLPFPLPQVTGHELVAEDEVGRRFVVEINASHSARHLQHDCSFCESGLATHCPERLVLGIHDLPGGFAPWVLVPIDAAIELAPTLSYETALLVEPFAASLNAASRVEPRAGDTIAVLGPRRLGMLVIAALAALRRRGGIDYEILAVSRHEHLLALSQEFGATATRLSRGAGDDLEDGLADIVIDTTASPEGLDLAVRLAAREVHLKSTHGQRAAGVDHLTELVVDEISLVQLPGDACDGARWVASLPWCGAPVRVAWLVEEAPPVWLTEHVEVLRGRSAALLFSRLEDESSAGRLPRVEAAVVDDAEQLDAVLRPSAASEASLVRPRGEIALAPAARSSDSTLLRAVAKQGLRLSSSRCGDFREALACIEADPELQRLGERLITHRFAATDITEAFEVARSPQCIKAVLDHCLGS
jgi:threonine dehydrogenase-like Zn-dependent dehydrogenase